MNKEMQERMLKKLEGLLQEFRENDIYMSTEMVPPGITITKEIRSDSPRFDELVEKRNTAIQNVYDWIEDATELGGMMVVVKKLTNNGRTAGIAWSQNNRWLMDWFLQEYRADQRKNKKRIRDMYKKGTPEWALPPPER